MREQAFPTGYETFSVVLNHHLLLPERFGRFQVRLLHQDHPQRRHICNRRGHLALGCPNLVCFNCDILDHIISIERLDSRDVVFVNP